MLAYGGNHFSVLLLLYRAREGYTSVEVDLLFALYIVGIIPGLLVAGPLSDRYGRKPLLVAGVVLGCLGSIVLAAGAGSVGVLGLGRFVSGVSVAIAMVVGSSWVKELSTDVPGPVAARRASLSLTAGFGLGPLVSGLLAQLAPLPTVLPYVVHIVLTLAAGAALLGAEETRAPSGEPRRPLLADLGVPREVRGAVPRRDRARCAVGVRLRGARLRHHAGARRRAHRGRRGALRHAARRRGARLRRRHPAVRGADRRRDRRPAARSSVWRS